MNETDARNWVRERFGVSRETELEQFGARIVDENSRQNLISATTIPELWNRHLTDSAQLIPLVESAPSAGGWLDIGSGAGFPGIVAAMLLPARPVILVEPRAKRAALLEAIAQDFALTNVEVHQSKVERIDLAVPAAIVSARAVAALDTLFAIAHRQTTPDTIWVLPKGRSAEDEVDVAKRNWRGTFHVERSITDPASSIVVARGVIPK